MPASKSTHHVDPKQPPGENTGVQFPDPHEAQIPSRVFVLCPVLTFPPLKPIVCTWGKRHPVLFVCNSFIVPPSLVCVGLCSLFKDAHQQRSRCNKSEEKETGPATPSLGSLNSKKDRPPKRQTLWPLIRSQVRPAQELYSKTWFCFTPAADYLPQFLGPKDSLSSGPGKQVLLAGPSPSAQRDKTLV